MNHNCLIFAVSFILSVATSLLAQEAKPAAQEFNLEPGFELIFNGKDLTGWNYIPTTEQQLKGRANWQKNDPNAPPWPIVTKTIDFSGKKQSDDGRFVADNGSLVVTVPPEGRKIQNIYTQREFEKDFTLKLEFRAADKADSGVFIRGRQLQCRDFLTVGPYKELKKFKPGEWNELVVVVKGRSAHCTCNGEVLESNFKVPASGPIGVEGDRGKLEYRNLRVGPVGSAGLLKQTNQVESWKFELRSECKGTISVDGNSIVFAVTSTGEENWHVQAAQENVALEEGTEYTLTFEMKSPDRVEVLVIGQINDEDWHEFGLHESLVTRPEFQKYSFKFKATNVAKNNRIGFILGEATGKVFLKNLKLEKE